MSGKEFYSGTGNTEINVDYVTEAFETLINRPKRGQKPKRAIWVRDLFLKNECQGVPIEALQALFQYTSHPISETSSTVSWLNEAFADLNCDLGIESRHYRRQTTYHLIKPSLREWSRSPFQLGLL